MLKQLALAIPPIRQLWNDRLALIKERDDLAAERLWLTAQRNRLVDQVYDLTRPPPPSKTVTPPPEAAAITVDSQTGLATNEITLGGIGITICGNLDDAYFKQLRGEAFDNSFLARVVRAKLPTDASIFDVGANIGVTTALFAQHAKDGQITSFEPSPIAFKYLEGTITANRLTNARALNVAIGATAGSMPFFDNPHSATASHLNPSGSLGDASHTVQVERLDDYAPHRLDFIKIDIEGHERGAIEGGLETIKAKKPLVFVEFNTFTLLAYGNENPRTFVEYLQSIFSDIQYMLNGETKHVNTKHELLHFIHANLISHHGVSDLLCIP